jgi:hypothetical protein
MRACAHEAKEIRANCLGFLDSTSAKQERAARGKATAATGTGRPPMTVALAKVSAMCIPYAFRSSLPLPCRLRRQGRPLMLPETSFTAGARSAELGG